MTQQATKQPRRNVLLVGLAAVAVLSAILYVVVAKQRMHDAVVNRIEIDSQIRQLVGAVESIDFDSSGSHAEFGGARSETLWILKVTGSGGCIYIHAVVQDTFPRYQFVSALPAKSREGAIRYCG